MRLHVIDLGWVKYVTLHYVVLAGTGRLMCICAVVKCHWTQGNAVPAPPVIEIQRSHTSSFIERVQNHLLGAHFGLKLIYSSLTSDFPL